MSWLMVDARLKCWRLSLNAKAAQVVLWRLGGCGVASCASGLLFVVLGRSCDVLVGVLALSVDECGVVAVLPGFSDAFSYSFFEVLLNDLDNCYGLFSATWVFVVFELIIYSPIKISGVGVVVHRGLPPLCKIGRMVGFRCGWPLMFQ